MNVLSNRIALLVVASALTLPTAALAVPSQTRIVPPPGATDLLRPSVFIRGGCPYNLDKVCNRNRRGKMVCHCAS